MSTAYASPLLISEDGSSDSLTRLPFSGAATADSYNEAWLQQLLYRFPSALPIGEIDDAYQGLIPVCREMQTPAGPIDVVYVTPTGRPVIVEAKLWRNPEARRKVIGQILDYAKELTHFGYDNFDGAVRNARRSGESENPPKGLVDVVRAVVPSLDEPRFCDSLTRNLRRGEFMLLIVGDGIREGAGSIAAFLESHGTLHFTLGLVEMAIYRMPDGRRLVQPRVLAQSEILHRTVVEVVDGTATIREESASEGDPPEEADGTDLEALRTRCRNFWTRFLDGWSLDNKGQPLPTVGKGQNLQFKMPKGSTAWINVYFAESKGHIGVFLTFSRGPTGDRLFALLEQDREEIDEALGVDAAWKSDGEKHLIAVRQPLGGDPTDPDRDDVRDWLRDQTNRFVAVFRPRLQALVES